MNPATVVTLPARCHIILDVDALVITNSEYHEYARIILPGGDEGTMILAELADNIAPRLAGWLA